MSSAESDVEMKTNLPKKVKKKTPKSPSDDMLKGQEKKAAKKTVVIAEDKSHKLTTKEMIVAALKELHTRKGVSLYAVKKYITEKYNVDTEKNNYLIKKAIKASVEAGNVIQMKGVGASGSFKLAPKEKVKKNVSNDDKPAKSENKEKVVKTKAEKVSKAGEKKEPKTKKDAKKAPKNKKDAEKPPKVMKKGEEEAKKVKSKIAKGMQTPSKKKVAMMKRKSIGSIIKPPKMRPKAKA